MAAEPRQRQGSHQPNKTDSVGLALEQGPDLQEIISMGVTNHTNCFMMALDTFTEQLRKKAKTE
jgi:hypothetical protein